MNVLLSGELQSSLGGTQAGSGFLLEAAQQDGRAAVMLGSRPSSQLLGDLLHVLPPLGLGFHIHKMGSVCRELSPLCARLWDQYCRPSLGELPWGAGGGGTALLGGLGSRPSDDEGRPVWGGGQGRTLSRRPCQAWLPPCPLPCNSSSRAGTGSGEMSVRQLLGLALPMSGARENHVRQQQASTSVVTGMWGLDTSHDGLCSRSQLLS